MQQHPQLLVTLSLLLSPSLFRLVLYLTSGHKNKQKTEAKINIAGARVVTVKPDGSFASIAGVGVGARTLRDFGLEIPTEDALL